MPSPYSERMPNGMDATLALLPDRWKKLLLAKEQDGPEVDQRFVRPAWSRNDNPVELSAPQLTTGNLVSGRDPGEMVVSRGGENAAPQEPIRPMPVLRPDLERLGIPQDAIEVPKTPQYQGGRFVGSNVDYAPPEMRANNPAETITPQNIVVPQPAFNPSITLQPGKDYVPSERLRRADLPIAAKTTSSMPVPDVRGGDTMGRAMPVDPNEMPDIPPRNFSQFVLAPDQTKNPDYAGQGVQSPAGEQTTRPKVVDKLGYAETHTPMPRHGRLYETGKGALLGFLRGVGTTGTLGGGIGGAATLGTMSAIDPQYAESAQNEMFTIPHLQQQEAIRVGRNEQALKQAGQVADIGYKRAQTDEATARASSLRNPKPTTFKGADGLQYEYDANTHTAKPIAGQGRVRAKVLRTVERSGKVWYETDDGLQPALDPKTGKQLEEELIPVALPGGATVKVKPAVAAQLSSTFANRRATAQEQEAFKQYGASLKAVRDRNRVKERDYTQAVKAGEDFNKLHGQLDSQTAEAQELANRANQEFNAERTAATADKPFTLTDPSETLDDKQRTRLNELRRTLPGLQARLTAEAKRLTDQYGQHLRYNEQERFEPLSSGPNLEDDPELPALNVGEGPQVGVSSAPQGKQTVNAQAYAKDHKISVEEARKLINSTPGYMAGN